MLFPSVPAVSQRLPSLPPGWTPLEELGAFLVHREGQPMARHRVACDLPALRRLTEQGPAGVDAALDALCRGAVRVSLTQDWLVDLSGRVRRERLEAFLDLHWTGREPWRTRPQVGRYLDLFSHPANTGDIVGLAFDPGGRLWVQLHPEASWLALPDRDLCRTLLQGLLGPKALDQGLRRGVAVALQRRFRR